jgi:hypothetical protein
METKAKGMERLPKILFLEFTYCRIYKIFVSEITRMIKNIK